MKMNILVVDDEQDCCDALELLITMLPGCTVYKAYGGNEALAALNAHEIDLVFSDVNMPGLNGIELTRIIKQDYKSAAIVLISGIVDVIKSINAIETGAYDFITKPANLDKIRELIEQVRSEKQAAPIRGRLQALNIGNLADNYILKVSDFTRGQSTEGAYLSTPSIENILHKLRKLWEFDDIPILIEGKTGTGKEVIAQYIHYHSAGKDKPFVAVNCAAINRELFTSELFGYEKGAFTGASQKGHEGFFKIAEGGTIFLDEITEIPLEMQTQLLRVLQEGEYYRVGGTQKQQIKTRIIFATNRNIRELVEKGYFREDLYFRINVCAIEIPVLAARKDDILPLTMLFIAQLNERSSHKVTGVEAAVVKMLHKYSWPGNIRELKNYIIKCVLFCEGGTLRLKGLELLPGENLQEMQPLDPDRFVLPENSFELEAHIRRIIKLTLEKFNGNKSQAARYLHLSRMQLYNKYKIDDVE